MVRNNNNNQDQSLDPYFVHPSENSSTVTVTPQLTGENYHSWSMKMRRDLAMKNKFKFVDGSIPIPEEDDLNYAAWERCNNLVHTWIINSISPSIAQSVVFIDNVVDIWNDLKDRFMRGDSIQVSQLQEESINCKQGSKKVTEFFTDLRGLWEELDQYRPMPQCTCPIQCTCLAMRNNKSFRAEDRIIKFLMGLNEDYQVSDLVNAMDGQRQFGRGRGNGFQGRGRGNLRVCSLCNRTNHTVETCYKKHGYPLNWGRGEGNSFANANLVECEDTEVNRSTSIGKNDENGMMLTKDQYQNLITLLERSNVEAKGSTNVMKASSSVANVGGKLFINNASCKFDDTSWIVDTCATHHTCHDLSWFTTCNEINPISVTLPNKNIVEACYKGNVRLYDTLHICNVLYLPEFANNLIFVSKLCKEQDCIVNFEANQRVIQENKDMRRIGLAEEMDGLYYLKAKKETQKLAKISSIYVSNNKSSSTVPPGILWHLRLGHLSHDRMQCMNKMYSYISVSTRVACDVCQMSRQKKLPFNLSQNNAHNMFDLVHVDIWGPLSTDSIHGFRYFLTILDDYSILVWVVMMKSKSEASIKVKSFVYMVENQFEKKVKSIRSDNGPEFLLKEFYAEKGILHQRSCVYTAQQN